MNLHLYASSMNYRYNKGEVMYGIQVLHISCLLGSSITSLRKISLTNLLGCVKVKCEDPESHKGWTEFKQFIK